MRLYEAVASAVELFPTRVAVSDAEGSWSYRELWEQVEKRTRNHPRNTIQLIQKPRSRALIAELLSVLRCGAIPLMLDPYTPSERRSEIAQLLSAHTSPENSEYAVTTSGSSGLPKVVLLRKGALVTMLRHQLQAFQINSDSTVFWMLSPGFDASYSDIGTALMSGAHLVCAPPDAGARLPELLRRHDATHLDIPPSLLRLYYPGEFPNTLRGLVVGGEPSPPELLRAWSQHHRVVAVYGPSETTVCSSLSLVDSQWDKPYLGRSLPGVKYRVRDGELLIGGPQVGLGYLGQNSSAFFFEGHLNWYASGDLVASEHSQHGFEFRGRRDRQIQRNGQRLELGEIEARATQVLERGAVAVIFSRKGLTLFHERGCSQHLQDQLQKSLPAAWVPNLFQKLQVLPRTSSGKIDYPKLHSLNVPALPLQDSLRNLSSLLELQRGGHPVTCHHLESRSTAYLKGETLLESLQPLPEVSFSPTGKRQTLLVTGATGRLGQKLLPRLRERFEIWTLQRSVTEDRSFQGDLRLPDFGLSGQDWRELEQVDEVLHLAADLDLTQSYAQVQALNTNSVKRLSRLGRPLHFASSLAAVLSTSRPSLDGELDPESVVIGGYAQSKWAAEALLQKLPLPGYTLRLGQLLETGEERELLWLVAKGLLQLACVPECTREQALFFDFTPLEWAAEETAQLLSQSPSSRACRVLRRGWSLHLLDLVEALRSLGFRLAVVSAEDFFSLPAIQVESQLAQKALGQLHPQAAEFHWPDFKLFLLGEFGKSDRGDQRECHSHLLRYLEGLEGEL